MAAIAKRQKAFAGLVDRDKNYAVTEALEIIKKTATAKFDESVDVAINLGIDAKKSDQAVRGSVVLPRGTGKNVRVAVFAQGDNAKKATDAGADIVGFEDLAERIKGGFMDFDVVIATPDAMRVVGALGQVLGPRGLMPNLRSQRYLRRRQLPSWRCRPAQTPPHVRSYPYRAATRRSRERLGRISLRRCQD